METTNTTETESPRKPATVAQCIRRDMKVAFPGIKFSVRTEASSSVRIGWSMGPTVGAVEAIVNKYEAGHFDGMTDCYVYNTERPAHPTTRFVFTDRDTSAVDEQVARDICAEYGVEYCRSALIGNCYATDMAYRALREMDLTAGYRGLVA